MTNLTKVREHFEFNREIETKNVTSLDAQITRVESAVADGKLTDEFLLHLVIDGLRYRSMTVAKNTRYVV